MADGQSQIIKNELRELADQHAQLLKSRTDKRVEDMEQDDQSHFLIYRVLGVTDEGGRMIDIYQNKGRFLYYRAGSFLEAAAKLCFKRKFPDSGSVRIPNTQGQSPKTFEIDCLVGSDAVEIKWRDATTDGDHIAKERTRIQVIHEAGYIPIRVMFYYPNRDQAIKIQRDLETLYASMNGQYYHGDRAWKYVEDRTGLDLKSMLEQIAQENAPE